MYSRADKLRKLVWHLSRQQLLTLVRIGRDWGILRPRRSLPAYTWAELQTMLDRHAEKLVEIREFWHQVRAYLPDEPRIERVDSSALSDPEGRSKPSEPSLGAPESPDEPAKEPPAELRVRDIFEEFSVELPAGQQRVLSPARREELLERLFPNVYGMEAEKEALLDWVYLPLAYPEVAKRYGLSTSPTVLLEGPPGTGKSYLLRAFAEGSGFWYRMIATPSLASKWYGDTERRIRTLFKKAESESPALLILEELDALFPSRDKNAEWLNSATMQLTHMIDLVRQVGGVAVLATTNRAHAIDQALLRKGRFDRRLYLRLPDYTERLLFFVEGAKALPFARDIAWERWAEETEGFSRADLHQLVQSAAEYAFQRHLETGKAQEITAVDLRRAFKSA